MGITQNKKGSGSSPSGDFVKTDGTAPGATSQAQPFNNGVLTDSVDSIGAKLNFNSRVSIDTTNAKAFMQIGPGSSSNAQLNLDVSDAPTTPNDGDIWFDGTNLKMQISGVTKTFTLI
jgi:hypothetical protein